MKRCNMIDVKKIIDFNSRLVINKVNNLPYIVYRDGRVYSVKQDKFLKPTKSTNGYLMLGSQLGSLHRLLVETFISKIPKNMVVNHKDGNKENNDLSNLEIVTYSENTIHAYKTGLLSGKPGENNSMAKITKEEYIEIAKLLKQGYDNEYIGNKYNIHARYVSLLRHGKRWEEMYKEYGPFPKSFKNKTNEYFIKFNEYKNNLTEYKAMSNIEIADIFGVDRSTVSRWKYRVYKEMRNDYRKHTY